MMGISKKDDAGSVTLSAHNGSHVKKTALIPDSPVINNGPVLPQVKKKKRRNKSKKKKEGGKEPSDVSSAQAQPDSSPVADQSQILTPPTQSVQPISEPKQSPQAQPVQPKTFSAPRPSHLSNQDLYKFPLSPRKQALMRYKKSDETIERSIAEIKGNLKSKANIPKHDVETLLEPTYIQSNMDEKVTLFKFKSSKILVFDEQLSEANASSSGRLLGLGEFEIFQLHNGDVTYLSCGPSFIYPLLPKLKVLRISFNQFILPLVNPERYWKIFINSEESNVIEVLESTLDRIVMYRNLFFKENHNINEKPQELKSLSIIDETESNDGGIAGFGLTALASDIPDSPPSAPISPHHGNLHVDISPVKHFEPGWSLGKKVSMQSINTNMACLDVREPKGIHHPKPKRPANHNPFQDIDEKSDSSMDSLLDEFDESITRSQLNRSRPPSRLPSVTSTSFLKAPQYAREPYFKGTIDKDKSQYDDLEDFPSTSLSEYNRARTHGLARSRRSSRSELYTSESNWMEPNGVKSRLAKSRSNYSINSDLNNTYHNIYKSITQRNLKQYLEDDNLSVQSQRLPTISAHAQLDLANLHENDRRPRARANSVRSSYTPSRPRDKFLDAKLNSADVYKLISARKSRLNEREQLAPAVNKPGLASRLFGW